MYDLKTKLTWADISKRLQDKMGIQSPTDAFNWFKQLDESAEDEELHAKAFDLALQALKVSHMDRRIFWSDLDKYATGGITYEEFEGKMQFAAEEARCSTSSATSSAFAKKRKTLDAGEGGVFRFSTASISTSSQSAPLGSSMFSQQSTDATKAAAGRRQTVSARKTLTAPPPPGSLMAGSSSNNLGGRRGSWNAASSNAFHGSIPAGLGGAAGFASLPSLQNRAPAAPGLGGESQLTRSG